MGRDSPPLTKYSPEIALEHQIKLPLSKSKRFVLTSEDKLKGNLPSQYVTIDFREKKPQNESDLMGAGQRVDFLQVKPKIDLPGPANYDSFKPFSISEGVKKARESQTQNRNIVFGVTKE